VSVRTQTASQILVSRPEAARLLGVSTETVRRLVARGVLEEIRFTPESHPRFRLRDVLALSGQRKSP
ncbi:MAG: helix-turn-helix domain-containing protein, partial [Actinobacteria bacterium]|nr:helix-turn-helix domain-containing protein [Actinomycetota bacterium]